MWNINKPFLEVLWIWDYWNVQLEMGNKTSSYNGYQSTSETELKIYPVIDLETEQHW